MTCRKSQLTRPDDAPVAMTVLMLAIPCRLKQEQQSLIVLVQYLRAFRRLLSGEDKTEPRVKNKDATGEIRGPVLTKPSDSR